MHIQGSSQKVLHHTFLAAARQAQQSISTTERKMKTSSQSHSMANAAKKQNGRASSQLVSRGQTKWRRRNDASLNRKQQDERARKSRPHGLVGNHWLRNRKTLAALSYIPVQSSQITEHPSFPSLRKEKQPHFSCETDQEQIYEDRQEAGFNPHHNEIAMASERSNRARNTSLIMKITNRQCHYLDQRWLQWRTGNQGQCNGQIVVIQPSMAYAL